MAVGNIGNAAFPTRSVGDIAPFGGVGIHSGGAPFPKMYTAELKIYAGPRSGFTLTTPLPANYQFNLSTSYDNPFNQPVSNLASAFGANIGGAADVLSTARQMASGYSTINKWLSGAVWNEGSLFTIEVPFVLQAHQDTIEEVVSVMKEMLQLVAPDESDKGFLIAPGPTMAGATGVGDTIGDMIEIRIGTFFSMRPCVIESVTCEFDTQMDVHNECPLSAVISVTAKSYFVTTKQDLDNWFLKG